MLVTLDAGDRIFEPGVVVIDGNTLQQVGPADSYRPLPGDEVLRFDDQIVMPGLVNTHTHSPMTIFRGVADDVPLGEWLPRYLLPTERRATVEDLHWSTTLGCVEMLLNGVTTIADRYSHMATLAPAIADTGIRAVLGATLTDARFGDQQCDQLALLERWGTSPESRIRAALAPHATDTCSPDLLRWIRKTADERGAQIYIHLAQSREEVADVAARWGVDGCTRYLGRHGVLGPDVIAAHCIYIDDQEVELLARSETRVAHCAVSNVRIEARMAPIQSMLAAGVVLGLGTDCAASNNGMDMFDEMKCAALLNKAAAGDPTSLPAARVLRMATTEAARVLDMEHLIGSIEVGKRADLITLDRDRPHLTPWRDPYGTLVYSATGRDVRNVFVDGQQVIRDGRHVSIDTDELVRRVAAIGARISRMSP
jgi:5-methylthioadenosine/S-adenosylhomocysteine deaminase